MITVARLIAAKDLRVERRSKIVTNQVLPFAGITMVSFAFALDKQNVLDTVAPGLVWLATMFSLLVIVQRTFAIETDDGALDAMRVAGVDPRAIYRGQGRMALGCAAAGARGGAVVCAAVILYGETIPSNNAFGSAVLLVTTHAVGDRAAWPRWVPCTEASPQGSPGSETLLPLLTLPRGGARPDRSNASGGSSGRHGRCGGVGRLALGGPAGRRSPWLLSVSAERWRSDR